MKLKAIILATGLINCIAFSAQAVDTTITVTGRELPRTCTIGNGGNPNATVVLDNAYTSDLIAANSTSQWKNFSLTLTNCQNVNNVTATFGGTAENTNYYRNTGDATNIMVELQEQGNGNTPLKVGSTKVVTVSNGQATFNLKVRAVSKGNAGAGSINSQITVTYTYA